MPDVIVDKARFKMTAETPQEVQEVLSIFFGLAEENFAELEQAAKAQKWDAWKASAHFLKGSAANLGMLALAEQCRIAEKAEALQAAGCLKDIRREIERLRDFFAQEATH